MEEEKSEKLTIFYKIMPNYKYRVWKTTKNDVDYYKIQVSQKNYDGETKKYYKNVSFKKGISLANGTDIIIKKGIENLRDNPLDQYNPISTIMITEFEEIKSQEQITKEALNKFNEEIDDIEIDDSMLPF